MICSRSDPRFLIQSSERFCLLGVQDDSVVLSGGRPHVLNKLRKQRQKFKVLNVLRLESSERLVCARETKIADFNMIKYRKPATVRYGGTVGRHTIKLY